MDIVLVTAACYSAITAFDDGQCQQAYMIQQQLVQLAVAQLVGVSNCGGHDCLGGFAKARSADCLELGLFGHAVEDVHLHLGRYQVSCTPIGKV